jgi:hypothetical protein
LKRLALLAALLCLAACTTTAVKTAAPSAISAPVANSKVLVIEPDVQLSLLTAAGLQEARQDWSKQGHDNLSASLKQALQGKTHRFEVLDPETARDGRSGQLLRLHDAVGQSIMAFNYGAIKLPTKKGVFDWTLGDGAQVLGKAHGADYALFVTGRGSYSSAGRKALMIGAAMLGVGIPLGNQQVFASLVDLHTGQVVWFNVANAGPSADMRSPDGAEVLTQALLKGAPLCSAARCAAQRCRPRWRRCWAAWRPAPRPRRPSRRLTPACARRI